MKKRIVLTIAIALIVLLGTSYAWFNFRQEGGSNRLIAGDIYLELDDAENNLTLTNIFPETASEARARENNVLTFGVYGKNTTNKTIYYEIKLNYGTSQDSPMKRFADSDLRFDLVEVTEENNQEVETYLLSNVGYDTINDQRIWVDTIDAEEDEEIEKTYRLRAWIAEDVIISDSYSEADYTASDYKNHYASIKVSVYGDMQEKNLSSLYQIVKNDVARGYALEYTGETQDSLNNYGNQKVYYYNGSVKDTDSTSATYNETMNNVIFGGFCWQMLRTTDTGGVKLVYNGRPVNNQCMSSRSDQMGIISAWRTNTQVSNGDYYYGTKFEVDYDNQTFKLTGTLTHAVWSTSTRNDLLGLYTCKSLSPTGTCATLYYIDAINSATNATVIPLTVASTHYGQVGTSGFNVVYNSPGYVGYMYNTIYTYHEKTDFTSNDNFLYGNDYVYENGSYHLDTNKSIITIANWSASYNTINNNHYTCFNTTGSCQTLYYIYYSTSAKAFYFELSNNKTHMTMLNEMIYDTNVNTKDSTAKAYLERWYENNLMNYTGYLEDTIYCNNRELLMTTNKALNYSGWNPNGGSTSSYLYFKECYDDEYILKCQNPADSFAVGNSKAPLNYPVGLLTFDEATLAYRGKTYSASFLNTGASTWLMSPPLYASYTANIRAFDTDGGLRDVYAGRSTTGMRPVISLKSTVQFLEGGTGAESSPYIADTN